MASFGGTLHPGLMVTSLQALSMDIRNIYMLLPPGFSGLTAFATYLFPNKIFASPSAGLLVATFTGIVPDS